MKKILQLLIISALIVLTLPLYAFAESALLPDITADPGESISIPLTVNDMTNLEGMGVTVTFDESVIDATGATLTGGVLDGQNYGLQVNTATDGQIVLIIYANANLYSGSGVVAYLQFDAGTSGNTDLHFTQFEVNETSYLGNTTDGSVTINGGGTDPSASLPDVTADPGESISIPLTVNDMTNLEGMGVTVTFDELCIDATGATLTGGVLESQNYGLQVNTDTPGQIILIIYANANLYSGSGVVAYLEFVVGSCCYTDLHFTQFEVNETSYLNNTTDGSVTVTVGGPGTIEGHVTLNGGSGNIEDVEVTADGVTEHPNANGDYVITIDAGTYDVTASLTGYTPQTISNVTVLEGQATTGIDFTLEALTEPSASLPDVTADPGESISIPLTVNNMTNLEGMGVTVTFDELCIDATGATLTGGVLDGQNYGLQVNTATDGQIVIIIYANANLYSGSGVVAYLEFDVVGSCCYTDLHFTQFEVNETSYLNNTTDGSVTVGGPGTIEGHVTLNGGSGNVEDVEVTADGITVHPDSDGVYVITIYAGTYNVTASLTGYTPQTISGVTVLEGQATTGVDFTLEYIPIPGTIEGTVTLNGGSGIVENVEVTANGETVNPGSNGDYVITIDAGTYDVTASLTGYTPQTISNVTVLEGQATTGVDFTLEALNEPSASLPDVTADPEESISIPLTVNDMTNLEGMGVTVTFDESVIDATGATLTGGVLVDQNYGFQYNIDTDGQIILIFYANANLYSGSGVVAYLEFDVVGSSGDSTDLHFTQFEVNETSYLGNTTDGSVTINVSVDDNPILLNSVSNAPNPFSRTTNLSFSLNRASHVAIDIFNTRGQLIRKVLNEDMLADIYSITWDGTSNNGVEVPTGVYFTRIITDEVENIHKVMLIR